MDSGNGESKPKLPKTRRRLILKRLLEETGALSNLDKLATEKRKAAKKPLDRGNSGSGLEKPAAKKRKPSKQPSV